MLQPTEWHRRPSDTVGPCPICGYPKKCGEHRAVGPYEGLKASWLIRFKSPTGWKTRPIIIKEPKRTGRKA